MKEFVITYFMNGGWWERHERYDSHEEAKLAAIALGHDEQNFDVRWRVCEKR